MPFGLKPSTGKFRKRVAAALAAAAIVIGGVSFTLGQSISGTSDVKIAAQRLEDDRIEFALEQNGELIKPESRYFPSDAEAGVWHKSSTVPVVQSEVMSTEAVAILVPRYSFVTQALIDEAIASPTGWATLHRGDGWFVAVDANEVASSDAIYSRDLDAWMCKNGFLWHVWAYHTDYSPFDGLIDFASLFANASSLEGLLSSRTWSGRDLSPVLDACSPLRHLELGTAITVNIPFADFEDDEPGTSVPLASEVTVSGRGENAEFFDLSAGGWAATMYSDALCSMWFGGAAELESIGELDFSGGRRIYTGVVESTGGTVWTDPIGCDGSWTITFTPID